MIEEQWEAMVRVAISLKQRTCPAHLIVQRLTSSYPSDRLSKAFTNLERIINRIHYQLPERPIIKMKSASTAQQRRV